MVNRPIIAWPRHHYESYEDLRRLVTLAELPTCYVDEVDPASNNTYIVPIQNSDLDAVRWAGAKARIIRWLFEWFVYPDVPGISETWCSDPWWSERIGARYVPLGSDKRLRETTTKTAPVYDVAYMGYMIPRREQIRHELVQAGLKVSATSAWGKERDTVLNSSSVYLQVHQRPEAPTIAPLRVVVAAAYKLPYITETVEARGILYHSIMTCSYPLLTPFVRMWTRKPSNQLTDLGAGLHALLCRDHPFEQTILNNL